MSHSILVANRPLNTLRTHLRTSVGNFYSHLTNRLLLYCLLGALFFLEGLVGLMVYKGPSLLISHMAFATVYALHTGLTYTGCQFAADVLACRLLPDWGCYHKRTVSKQWLIWFAGFTLAFVIHRTIVLCLVHIYAPDVVAYYADPRRLRPSHGTVFFYILPYWAAGIFLAVNIVIHVQKRLFSKEGPGDRNHSPTCGSLAVNLNDKSFAIPYREISHITVEDHYSRIYFIKDNAMQNVFIRKPLKALRQSLPEDRFLQIHRSHLVNLRLVCGLSRTRRELTLKSAQNETILPVSRYRLSDLCKRLMDYPSEQRDQLS